KNKFTSEKDLLENYEQDWIDEWYQDKRHQKKFKEKGRKMLKMFYRDFIKASPQVKYLEKPFNFKLDQFIIKGKIDRVDETKEGLEIIDYKTGKPRAGKLDAKDKQQLLIYQLASQSLSDVFNKPISKLTYYYLETGERVSFLGQDKELKQMQEKIVTTIKKIKSSNFPAQPSRMCKYCDFYDICEYRYEGN
ncbi:PD-(D/E)XK nuclease family protein, partial [Patescibacteria group bacterium]|nr:PD-(D/E)XK nuclease family protein [Patescibacteria group bacterium]